jgi:hypothetical protein
MRKYALVATFVDESEWSDIEIKSFRALIKSLDSYGCSIHIGIASDLDLPEARTQFYDLPGETLTRKNVGYDFGTWKDLLHKISLERTDKVLFINTSLIGPFFDPNPIYDFLFSGVADYLAITESAEVALHFQSYMWSLSGESLMNSGIREFLNNPLSQNTRQSAIFEKEVPLLAQISKENFFHKSLFEAGSVTGLEQNPTLFGWKRMIDGGFPFFKKSLLGNNSFLIELASFSGGINQSLSPDFKSFFKY